MTYDKLLYKEKELCQQNLIKLLAEKSFYDRNHAMKKKPRKKRGCI